MFIENVLGTSSKVKILRTLAEIAAGFTLTELERETGLSRGIVHKEARRLVRNNALVEIKLRGKLKVYRINVEHPYYSQLINIFEKERQTDRKNVVILAVWNILESLISTITDQKNDKEGNIFSIKLFGSHARGTAAITSDIDLLILMVEKNRPQEDYILSVCQKYSEKIKIVINPSFMKATTYADEFKKGTRLTDQISRGGMDLFQR